MASKASHRDLRVRGRLVVEEVIDALRPVIRTLTEDSHSQGVGPKSIGINPEIKSTRRTKEPAGSPWLQDSALHVALLNGGELLAFAKGKELVIVNTTGSGGDMTQQAFVCNEVQSITCLEWLLFPGHGTKDRRPRHLQGGFVGLAVGTLEGGLLIYSHAGVLLARQMLHTGPLLRLRARGPAVGLSHTDLSQDLCAVFETAIVRIDAVELQSALRRSIVFGTGRESNLFDAKKGEKSQADVTGEPASLSFRKWRVQKGFGPCSDGSIGGLRQGPLLDLQDGPPEYCIVTVGKDPTIAAFRVLEEMEGLSTSVIASRVARNVSSAASSVVYKLGKATVAKAPRISAGLGLPSWSTEAAQAIITNIGLTSNTSAEGGKRGALVDPQVSGKGESAVLGASLRDPMRHAVSLVVAPRGPLMAVTDRLGRVLLLDSRLFAVVRQWKGYRDASCAFLEIPASGHVTGSQKSQSPNTGSQLQLCLAIFAPRKGVLEVWQLRNGPRLLWLRCGFNCRLLQPSSSFGSVQPHNKEGSNERSRAYLFDGDGGQLFEISPSMNAASRQFPRASSSNERGLLSEWDIYQRLIDVLHYQSGAMEAARQLAMQWTLQYPSNANWRVAVRSTEDQTNEERFLKQGSFMDEESVILHLLEALEAPMRKLKALDMLVTTRPSLRESCHLKAVRIVLDTLASILQPTLAKEDSNESGQKMRPGSGHVVSQKNALPSTKPMQQIDVDDQIDRAVFTTTTLRRRVTTSGSPEDMLAETYNSREGGSREGNGVTKPVEPVESVSKEASTGPFVEQYPREFDQRVLQLLREKQGLLIWQECLLEVFILLQKNNVQSVGKSGSFRRSSGEQLLDEDVDILTPKDALKPIRLLPKTKVRGQGLQAKPETGGRYKWEPGADLRAWVEIGGPTVLKENSQSLADRAEKQGVGKSLLTCADFLRAFVTDPNIEPSSVTGRSWRDKQTVTGLRLVSAGDETMVARLIGDSKDGMEDDIVRLIVAVGRTLFGGLLEGGDAIKRTLEAMDRLPLTGHEWQQLFLGWLGNVSLEELLQLESSFLLDLIKCMGSLFKNHTVDPNQNAPRTFEGTGGAGRGTNVGLLNGGRHPVFFQWCQLHYATGATVVLARACSMVADMEQETIGMNHHLIRDEGKTDGRIQEAHGTDDEAMWLEHGAEQWRKLTKHVEDALWLGSAVNYVIQESEARGLVCPSRHSPSATEVASFPVASWVARLELLITPSARTLAALHKTFLFDSDSNAKLTHANPYVKFPHLPSMDDVSVKKLTKASEADEFSSEEDANSGEQKQTSSSTVTSTDVEQKNGPGEVGEFLEKVGTVTTMNTESIAKHLLRQVVQRFPQICHPDILAAHRSLELCRQWANTSQVVELGLGLGGKELLLVAQEHMAQISTLGLKGGIVASMWALLIGPRAASVVGLVERLGRAPTDEECAEALGMAGMTAETAADAVAAYEQLLALLFDCATLAEAGLTREPQNAREEDSLSRHDTTCRDAVADFRMRAPNSERVHAYMMLLRTVGATLALGVTSVHLSSMFSPTLLANFPALFQDLLLGHREVVEEWTRQASLEAKLQFLQAALLRQRVLSEEINRGGDGNYRGGSQYANRSISSLAADLEVPHRMLRQREGVVTWLLAGADQSEVENVAPGNG